LRKVRVNITKYVSTEAGLRYCPAVITSNGRIKQNIVLVGGKEERHPEGAYYLDWRENGVRTRLSVGKDAQDALTQRDKKAIALNAANHGIVIAEPVATEAALQSNGNGSSNGNGYRLLAAAVTEYLDEIKLGKKQKTHAAYSTALTYFLESCKKIHLEDIDRKDMLRFSAFLRDVKELHPRTCWNKFSNVMSFLKAQKIRGLVEKGDWPSYTEEVPEIYEREELDALFAACDAEERLWFEFFLMTGMREQEVMYTYWGDVNLKASKVKVTHKPDLGWTPKAYKEREIPIPAKLVTSLQVAKAAHDKACRLVFPTAGCRPKLNFLDDLKAVAERAGLDPAEFWLHKFRATFATRWLRKTDLATVQTYLGHSDVESTMRYLRPADDQGEKANEIFGDAQ
jgi:integrase/recombinase XerD